MKRITVVISEGQSANPEKRKLEEDLVGALLFESGVEVVVVPHLYDLTADGAGMLCLNGIAGDMVVLSWLFPRAAHWTLDRGGIRGHFGATLLKASDEEEAEEEDGEEQASANDEAEDSKPRVVSREVPNRKIYHLDLRAEIRAQPYIDEVQRIVAESTVKPVSILSWPPAKPLGHSKTAAPASTNATPAGFIDFSSLLSSTLSPVPLQAELSPQLDSSLASSLQPLASTPLPLAPSPQPLAPNPVRVEESPARRWYPVIDYSRCTNCMECIDFCLFGVYGVDRAETILVEQPDNCRKGCPACSRVCPENAIIFPQHKTPAIAGSAEENAGGLKIDLSQLFGAPTAIEVAALERDVELVATGRDAVGLTIGIPKRQAGKASEPKDDLDSLMDELDNLAL